MFSALINRITEYIKLKSQQIKLEIISHSARLLSHVIVVGFLGVLGLFMILLLSVGLSAYFNEVFESVYLGYLIVAGGYFLLILIIAIMAKTGVIQNWIEATILKAIDQREESE
ncbi:MAG: phage holin family protein [Cytophagales bacterium]|nr:phage holin family protein [Cytophagales bacterium]